MSNKIDWEKDRAITLGKIGFIKRRLLKPISYDQYVQSNKEIKPKHVLKKKRRKEAKAERRVLLQKKRVLIKQIDWDKVKREAKLARFARSH